jgi:hypothetical protein
LVRMIQYRKIIIVLEKVKHPKINNTTNANCGISGVKEYPVTF